MLVVEVRELERCAQAWEQAGDEVAGLVGVLAELDPHRLEGPGEGGGELVAAATEFVAALRWWVEHLVVLARARADALWAWADEVAGTERSVVGRFGGGSW